MICTILFDLSVLHMPVTQRTYIFIFRVKITENLQFDQKGERIACPMMTHVFSRDLGHPLW